MSETESVQKVWRAWLERSIRLSGMKPTPFAKKANLAPSTILHAIDQNNPVHITLRTIHNIVRFHGVKPPFGSESGQQGFSEDEVTPFEYQPNSAETGEKLQVETFTVNTRAIELSGYVIGDTIWVQMGLQPNSGDAVLAQVVDLQHGAAETVMRIFEAPYYLVTRSADPLQPAKPLQIDNERVQVVGTIIRAERIRSAS